MNNRNRYALLLFAVATLTIAGCSDRNSQKDWQLGANASQQAHISSNLQYVMTTAINAPSELWQLGGKATGKFAWQMPNNAANHFVVSDLSIPLSYAITASGKDLIMWNTKTGKSIAYWQLPFAIIEVKASQKTYRSLVRTSDGKVHMVDLRNGRIPFSIPLSKSDGATRIALDNQGLYAAIGTKKGRIYLWSLKNTKLIHRLQPVKPGEKISFLLFSDDGKKLVSSTFTGLSQIWHTKTGKLRTTLKVNGKLYKVRKAPAPILAAQFSPKAGLLATASPNGIIRIWSSRSGYVVSNWQLPTKSLWNRRHPTILALAFTSRAKSVLSVTSDNTVSLWKIK